MIESGKGGIDMMTTDKCNRIRVTSLRSALVLAIVLCLTWCGCVSLAYAAEQDGGDASSQDAVAQRLAVATPKALDGAADELPYDINWYLVDPDIDSYAISTSRELLGLAQLVNGTAVDWDGKLIPAVDFSGRTIELLEDVTLLDGEGARVEFVPIGTLETPFAGTFDGCGHSVRNLSITQTYTYAGLFGFASQSSAIKNVNLSGGGDAGIALFTETEYIADIGALVGKTDGSVSNCSSDVSVYIDSQTATTAEHPYVVQHVGGLVGFARGDMTGCSFSGALTSRVHGDAYSADTTSDSLRVADSIGGVVGRFGDPDCHGTLRDSYNIGDVTAQTFGAGGADRFGETTFAVTFFVGGVVGYSNGSIYNCHNGSYDVDTQIIIGRVLTGVPGVDGALMNNRGGDQVGGICGSLRGESDDPDKYNDGDPDDPMVIADCHNEAQVTGLCATGGIVGQTGVYCTVTRCFNGSITDLSDWQRNQQAGKVISTRWNKPLSGGIVGQTRSGTISYCANYAEVRNIQTGYYMAGIAGCIFTSDDYPNVTGEIYACFNSGGIYTINESTNVEYREAGICGDNEGYVHDCIVMQGSVPYHSDQAIGNMDWGVTSNIYVKSARELQSPESAALLNAVAEQNQDWTCYWFINREGYPLLNSWAVLDDSQRIQLTPSMIASTQELEPAPYMGKGQDTLPIISVTLTDGTVLVQNTDFYVIPQAGAYEMSVDPIYSAGIVGIGLYMGTVSDCAQYSIAGCDLSKASVFVSTQKYNFGKVVFPTTVEARIGGAALSSEDIEYIIYGSQTSTSAVESGMTVFPAFDSEGFISYDAAGNVMYPVSGIEIEALNAETRDYWLWDRDGRLISDSAGRTYYASGNAYAGTTSCVNLKAGTPAGYVVKVSAKSGSVGLTGHKIGYYVIDPVNLYRDCVFSGALLGDQMWNWDVDASRFYIADGQGGVLDDNPAATFTGNTITLDPVLYYGDYQLAMGRDIRVANGDPNPSEVGVSPVGDSENANRNVTDDTTRAAITVLPVSTSSMSNYLIAYFEIAPADFANCDIQLASSAMAYTGRAIEPEVIVKLDGVKLIEGVDYEVSYSNNVEKGTAHYTVTPLANLSGGATEPYEGTFTIGDGVDLGAYRIDAIDDQQFNWGYDVHPQLTFRDGSGQVVPLVEGSDYDMTLSGTNVTKWPATEGAAESSIDPQTVTVTGKGLYVGELTAAFHIVPYDATANFTNQLRVFTQDVAYGTWGKPATETTLSDGTRAKRAQFENYGPDWPVLSVAAYPVRDWTAYEAGDYESCYAEPIAIVRQNNNDNGKLVYPYPVRYYDAAGNEVAADNSVYTNSNRVVIARPQAAQPGTITARVHFETGTSGLKNGATGYIEKTFEYTSPASLSTVQWTVGSNDERTYDGTAKTPIVATMKGTGERLVEGTDYVIEYADNVNAGTATYTATAVEGGHFEGTHEGVFSVLPYSLSGEGVTIDDIPDQVLVDAEAGVEPVPVVRVGDTVLQAGIDYDVRYQNNHTVGDNGAVIIVGKGNYTSTLTKTFCIIDNPISGGDTIVTNGMYYLADDATGTITIDEGINARIKGRGIDTGAYYDLTFDVKDGATLTIENIYANLPTNQGAIPFVEFNGNGTLNIEGVNRVEMGEENNVAALHVVCGDEVHLGGTGTLYGYKAASSPFIGVNMAEAVADNVPIGDVVFDGGAWYLAGTKMGPVIGNDLVAGTDAAPMGTVTVNTGTIIYAKSVSQGAVIGGSKNGVACNLVVNGGLMELYTDYNASTIGAGGAVAHGSGVLGVSGTVVFNGGSVKTVVAKNGYGSSDSGNTWAGEGLVWTSDFAQVSDATITAAHDTKLLVFDASEYADVDATGSEAIEVFVDGALFYQGGLYPSLTSELKNPAGGDTLARWIPNNPDSAYPEGMDTSGVYPFVNGSTFAPDYNLYFHLSKADHVLTVGDDTYDATWNAETGEFSLVKRGKLVPTGWQQIDGVWRYYYGDGTMATSKWVRDGSGEWCFLGADGARYEDRWAKDSRDWYFMGADGHPVKSKWMKDSKGWCYLGADGAMVAEAWQADSKGMCYLDGEGHAVTSAWKKLDGKWYYFDDASHAITNQWKKDSKGWLYMGEDGAAVASKWVRDSKGWCYVGPDAYMVTNKWAKDSKHWYYMGADGHMVTSKWQKDSAGWCYLGSDGAMVTSAWQADSKGWCYLDSGGHALASTTATIDGVKWKFDAACHATRA